MNGKRLCAVGLIALGALSQGSCSPQLDLCGDAPGPCLTVQANADTTDPVDLLRAIYTVDGTNQKEMQFMSPPGGSPLPAGFALSLTSGGALDLQLIAERNLRPTLRGSAQLTLAGSAHQSVTVTLTPDLSNLPYSGPPPRHHAGMVYAPSRNAVVLFGGIDGSGSYLSDTWELDVGSNTWSQHAATGPSPAARTATLAYDPNLQRVILAGGTDANQLAVADLWFYDNQGNWTQAPAANHGGGYRTDAALTVTNNGVIVVAGGLDTTRAILQDVLTYDPAALINGPDFIPHTLMPPLPKVRTPKLISPAMPIVDEVYLIGADEADPNSTIALWHIKGALSTAGSTLLTNQVALTDSAAPSHRSDFALTTDVGFIYLFGGTTPTGASLQDAYVFAAATKQWARVDATVTPTARAAAQLALLPPALLLLGGMAPPGSQLPLAFDNWKLTLGSFTAPTTPGTFVRHP